MLSSFSSSVSLILQPFAPAALPAFLATTASADFSAVLPTEISPGKMQNLSPRAAWLYHLRLGGLRASLLPASSPNAVGLAASSSSYGRGFATRFFQLHLPATPCASLRLPPPAPIGSFLPTRFCPCWAHWRGLQAAGGLPARLISLFHPPLWPQALVHSPTIFAPNPIQTRGAAKPTKSPRRTIDAGVVRPRSLKTCKKLLSGISQQTKPNSR
jgi:hypothetical protein